MAVMPLLPKWPHRCPPACHFSVVSIWLIVNSPFVQTHHVHHINMMHQTPPDCNLLKPHPTAALELAYFNK
jgi:hypothetical protein